MLFFNPFSIHWYIAFDPDGEILESVGMSNNRVYVTLNDPQASPLFETVLDIAVRNADGLFDTESVVASIYSDFTDRSVARKAMDGMNVEDGAVMQYWANEPSELLNMISDLCQPMTTMISPELPEGKPALQHIGTCVAWSQLLRAAWMAHGITDAVILEVRPPGEFLSTLSAGQKLDVSWRRQLELQT